MSNPQTLIALDFDGVLNNLDYLKGRPQSVRDEVNLAFELGQKDKARRLHAQSHIDPACVAVLEALVKETGAEVFISSSWRKLHPLEDIRFFLRTSGFTGKIIGATPTLSSARHYKLPDHEHIERGMEIEHWLLTSIDRDALPSLKLVILDDDADFGRLLPYHVQTAYFGGGLKEEHIERVREVLALPPAGALLSTPNTHWYDDIRNELYGQE